MKRSKSKIARKPHQKKPIRNQKSLRGCPEIYSELKKPTSVALTATAVRGLDEISAEMNLSRSELIERIGRKLLEVVAAEPLALMQEVQ